MRCQRITRPRATASRSDSTVSEPRPDPLAPVRAMIEALPAEAVEEVGRALHARLNAPITAAERRVKELLFLTRLLEEQPQPPDRLPYIPRKLYDQRRVTDAPDAPLSARLHERFGSWIRACHAAWGLRDDGRSFGEAQPWPRTPRRRNAYSVDEAKASVRQCADAIGHRPSSYEYHMWVMTRRARARAAGETVVIVHLSTVNRLLAPDRKDRNGWRLVEERVFDDSS